MWKQTQMLTAFAVTTALIGSGVPAAAEMDCRITRVNDHAPAKDEPSNFADIKFNVPPNAKVVGLHTEWTTTWTCIRYDDPTRGVALEGWVASTDVSCPGNLSHEGRGCAKRHRH